MSKINKILIGMILISCLLLGIGYSAIQNITLEINGTVKAKPTWKRLVTGKNFNQMVKDGTTIKKIVFDYWENGYSENGTVIFNDWETGTEIDEDGAGVIRLFKSNDGTRVYVLSASNIMANNDCDYMFQNFANVTEIIFNNFNTSGVVYMRYMFDGASSIQELNLNNFDTKNVLLMTNMFANMTSLTKLETSKFNAQKVHNMVDMFYNCNKLTSLNLSGFSYNGNENVLMVRTFYGMTSLTYLDLRNYDFSKVTGYWNMGYEVPSNAKIIVKDEIARQWLKNTSGTKLNSATIVLVSEL